MLRIVAASVTFALLAGCATTPPPQAQAELQYLDLPTFDSQLAASLAGSLPRVEVAFYDKVAPSRLPDRLQRWLASVESGGGKVSVNAPPSTLAAKSPMVLISAISALWSAHKVAGEAGQMAELRAARRFNAELHLRQDERGDVSVGRIVFLRKAE